MHHFVFLSIRKALHVYISEKGSILSGVPSTQ